VSAFGEDEDRQTDIDTHT